VIASKFGANVWQLSLPGIFTKMVANVKELKVWSGVFIINEANFPIGKEHVGLVEASRVFGKII
jgi:hypothetical protein